MEGKSLYKNYQDKPDIVSVLRKEGIQVKPMGKYWRALCPLHREKNPSFCVDPKKQTFRCFGCNKHGDAITFVQLYKGLSFRDALNYLNLPHDWCLQKRSVVRDHQQYLISKFREWCDEYHDDLCLLYRTLQKTKLKAKTIEEVEALAEFYHKENLWLCQIEILLGRDDEAKFELYKEWQYGKL